MAHLVFVAVLLSIVSMIIESSHGSCSGYATKTFRWGKDPSCDNPRERTGLTWLGENECYCCPGFVRDSLLHDGTCVPICWSNCADQDPKTDCTYEQMKKHKDFVYPDSTSMECPAQDDTE